MNENRTQIYMIKYSSDGRAIDSACGEYNAHDVSIFENSGFVYRDRDVVERVCRELAGEVGDF